jgi:hypothetical protein
VSIYLCFFEICMFRSSPLRFVVIVLVGCLLAWVLSKSVGSPIGITVACNESK